MEGSRIIFMYVSKTTAYIQPLNIYFYKHLLCARYYSRVWRYKNEQNKQGPCSHRVDLVLERETDNKI